jgi:hypothetical protein
MAHVSRFKYRPKKQRTFYLSVPVWIGLVGFVFYSEFSGMQPVNFPMGQSLITADQKFTFCSDGPQRNCVVDGDTIYFAGIKIRVEDINTPEIHEYKCEQELKRGLRAKSRMLELVNEGPFKIVIRGWRRRGPIWPQTSPPHAQWAFIG